MRPGEICTALKLSRSRYFQLTKAIRKEDEKFVAALRTADLASSLRMTIESLEDVARKLILIYETAERDSDRIEALKLRYLVELDLLNVQVHGPSIIPLARRITSVKKFNEALQDSLQPQD